MALTLWDCAFIFISPSLSSSSSHLAFYSSLHSFLILSLLPSCHLSGLLFFYPSSRPCSLPPVFTCLLSFFTLSVFFHYYHCCFFPPFFLLPVFITSFLPPSLSFSHLSPHFRPSLLPPSFPLFQLLSLYPFTRSFPTFFPFLLPVFSSSSLPSFHLTDQHQVSLALLLRLFLRAGSPPPAVQRHQRRPAGGGRHGGGAVAPVTCGAALKVIRLIL